MRSRVALILFLLALGPRLASATTCLEDTQKFVDAFRATSPGPADHSFDIKERAGLYRLGTACLVESILRNAVTQEVVEAKVAAIKAAFQQTGASSGSGGATSVTSKGATAHLFSTAVEYGALTESQSNKSVTLQGSLGAIPAVAVNKMLISACSAPQTSGCVSLQTINALNRFSYGISFDTSQNAATTSGTATMTSPTMNSGTAQQATFTANSHTLNSATAKAILVRGAAADADTVNQALKTLPVALKALDENAGKRVIDSAKDLQKDCPDASPASSLAKWEAKYQTDLEDIATKIADQKERDHAVETKIEESGKTLIGALGGDGDSCKRNYVVDAVAVSNALSNFKVATNAFFEGLRSAPVVTLEYNFNRPAGEPTNSTVRLIGQMASKSGFTGTLNLAGSFYNQTPPSSVPGAGKVRDFQAAAEGAYDFSKGKNLLLGHSTASLAYYYQDQTSPAILNVTPGQPITGVTFTGLPSDATQVFAKRGPINLAQAKFTLIPGTSGFNIPLSVTWSNRTELVTNSVWRGQVGISYDFDSLFSSK